MARCWREAARIPRVGAWVVAGLAACQSDAGTGLLLAFDLAPAAPRPSALAIDSRDQTGRLLLHWEGAVAEGAPLPQIFLAIEASSPAVRMIVAQGVRDGVVVAEGAAQALVEPGRQVRLTVVLEAGRLPDRDGDGVPDIVDGCPAEPGPRDRCSDSAPDSQPPPDAGPVADAPSGPDAPGLLDALIAEASVPETAPHDAPDGATDPGAMPDARRDASLEAPAPDTGPAPGSPEVLLLRGQASGPHEAPLEARLRGQGLTVVSKSGAGSTERDADGKVLIVISISVAEGDIGTRFRAVAVPVIVLEPRLFDDMAMTGPAVDDFGTTTNQTQIAILMPTHPLAAGLTGAVDVSTMLGDINWGRPQPAAVRVASVVGDTTRAALFGYGAGAQMAGAAAPARRVGFFAGNTVSAHLNGNGQALFDAAVRWALTR